MGCVQSVPREWALYEAAKSGMTDEINRLVRKTVSSEAKRISFEFEDVDGRTPMVISIENGHLEATLALLQHGVDVNAVSVLHGTALLVAMKAENFGLVDILLQRGACPFLRNFKGLSAWEYALINSRNAGILREFERFGYVSGLLRFQVPVSCQSVDGKQVFTRYAWTRLWVSVVPEITVHRNQVFIKRVLHVFNHSKSFTPMCIAELDGAKAQIMGHDTQGITATLELPILPYQLKGFASVGTMDSVTLYVKEFHQDDKFLLTFLNVCDRNWLDSHRKQPDGLERTCLATRSLP